MNYMETVIIITEIKLTTTVNDNIHELYIHDLYDSSPDVPPTEKALNFAAHGST